MWCVVSWSLADKTKDHVKNQKSEGFQGTIRLGKIHKKTKETERVTMCDHDSFFSSALEARHSAATYALYRVASHLALHRLLPPSQRDYWNTLETKKLAMTNDVKRESLYAPDPFTALESWNKEKEAKEKKYGAIRQQKSSDAVSAGSSSGASTPRPSSSSSGLRKRKIPQVHLCQDAREQVEALIKTLDPSFSKKKSTDAPLSQRDSGALQKLGFRPAHITEASEYCSEYQEALHWLCINVPEDGGVFLLNYVVH
jgi:ATP-dependent RNA helicase DHX57